MPDHRRLSAPGPLVAPILTGVIEWRWELTRLELALAECGDGPLPLEPLGRLLMEGELYVVPEGGRRRPVAHVFGGGVYVPAYTTAGRMRSVMLGARVLALPGVSVLRAVPPGAQLILNLGTWPSRVVEHWDVGGLLEGWDRLPAEPRIEQPTYYPGSLLEALWDHFRAGPVAEAYFAQVAADGRRPRLLVGIRARTPAPAARIVAQTVRVARAVYDAEVHIHHLGPDELSRRIIGVGSCFFDAAAHPHPTFCPT
jgi:hypothetical protein